MCCDMPRPANISADGSLSYAKKTELRGVTAAAFLVELLESATRVVVTAAAVLVELFDRETLRSHGRSNCTSNKRYGDKR